MIQRSIIGLTAGAIIAGFAGFAFAADKTVPALEIVQRLNNAGIKQIRVLELQGNNEFYKAEVMKPNGELVELEIDAKTGKFPMEKVKSDKSLSALQVMKRVNKDGFTHITRAKFDAGNWQINAKDKKGSNVQLTVDPSGRISK